MQKTKDLTRMSMMTAIIFLATYFIKIPIPATNGYTHLGDCMIFISIILLGTKKGALVGAVGAALSDFLGGFAYYIVPTFFIKGCMALIVGAIAYHVFPNKKYGFLIGMVVGGIFQIIGYTLVKILYVGLQPALLSIFSVTTQTTAGIVIAAIASASLSAVGIEQFKNTVPR